jgi:hypothetical protein
LRAVGEHAAARRAGTPDTLTAHEAPIARLAAEGAMKVFRKLGVTSRAQLPHALSAPAAAD